MLSLIRDQRWWKVAVEPVKWTPARSRWGRATSETASPRPVTRLMTPGGRPASVSRSMSSDAESCWVVDGFQTTVLPSSAGAGGRLPALEAVPGAGRGVGLVVGEVGGEVDVGAPEVDQLAGGVDLRLDHRLALAEHGGRVDPRPPGPGEEVGGAQEDGGAGRKGGVGPFGAGRQSGVHGRCDLGGGGLVAGAEDQLVTGWGGDPEGGPRSGER